MNHYKGVSMDSNLKKSIFSSSSNSSNEPRKSNNENIYYYINEDGARITVFTIDYLNQFKKIKYDFEISRLIADLIKCQHYNISYDEVINFAISEIKIRKTNFCAFLKHRQYTNYADNMEKYLHERNLNCIQTQCVLVKDFYKQIKQPDSPLQIFQFNEISSMN